MILSILTTLARSNPSLKNRNMFNFVKPHQDKIKSNYINLIGIFFVCVSLYAIYILFKENKNRDYGPGSLPFKNTTTADEEANFLNIYKNLIVTSDGKVLDRNILLNDSNNQQISFAKLISSKGNCVVLRAGLGDKYRLSHFFSLLNPLKNKKNILLILDRAPHKKTILKLSKEIKIYYLQSIYQSFNIPLEGKGLPYFFQIDSTLKISKILVPFEDSPTLTIRYLDKFSPDQNRVFIPPNRH
ncbi:hypothetical protein DBR40_25540 [Pedobacter sp. KBW01]|nr:hypothetical protein DBR40_25540 [Pedobacter sp. KBW01]